MRVGKRPLNRKAKLVFLALAVGLAVVVWLSQLRGPMLPGWEDDLEAALKRGAQENRRVLILFLGDPPNQTTRGLAKKVLDQPASREAIQKGNFIRVRAELQSSLKSSLAKKYRIRTLPSLVIISPEGKELNRREGNVGFADFWGDFLNCTRIVKPGT